MSVDSPKLFSCPVCSKNYNNASRKPQQIGICGHSICAECAGNPQTCGVCNEDISYHRNWQINHAVLDSFDPRMFPCCSVCSKIYDNETRKPYQIGSCGHSLCEKCRANQKNCGVCNVKIVNYFGWKINHALLGIVIDRMAFIMCKHCLSVEKTDKMVLCLTCSKMNRNNVEELSIDENIQIHPFLFCPSCVVDAHLTHDMIKYSKCKNLSHPTGLAVTTLRITKLQRGLYDSKVTMVDRALNQWTTKITNFASTTWSHLSPSAEPLLMFKPLTAEVELLSRSIEEAEKYMDEMSYKVQKSSERLQELYNSHVRSE